VLADQNLALHVAENLISNAIKFSPFSSTVEIFLADRCVGMVTFGVRDQGPGLTESDQAKLFGAFQRLSAKPTGGESSTGLGLSITKRMIEAMGGCIWCESEPGKGATFFVALPAASQQSTNGTDAVLLASVEPHPQCDSVQTSVPDRVLAR
jgi:signal transduction histidine kinase